MSSGYRRALALLLTVVLCSQAFAETVTPKLVICGGGSLPPVVYERFRTLAGSQPKLVYIPTASERTVDERAVRETWKTRGFDDVTVLDSDDRTITTQAAFAEPLRNATAVWFGGGSQTRLANAYLDTPIETELNKLLERGGVIGGTSAGAAIQSRVMIASGRREPNVSVGMNLLKDAIIDQHFLKRDRITRLMEAVKRHPEKTGFGIDESTALIVSGDQIKVVGQSYVIRIRSIDGDLQVEAYRPGQVVALPSPAVTAP